MKILYRCTAVLLSLALVLTSMPSEALALRPIAYKAEIDAAADYDEEEEVEPDDETLPDEEKAVAVSEHTEDEDFHAVASRSRVGAQAEKKTAVNMPYGDTDLDELYTSIKHHPDKKPNGSELSLEDARAIDLTDRAHGPIKKEVWRLLAKHREGTRIPVSSINLEKEYFRTVLPAVLAELAFQERLIIVVCGDVALLDSHSIFRAMGESPKQVKFVLPESTIAKLLTLRARERLEQEVRERKKEETAKQYVLLVRTALQAFLQKKKLRVTLTDIRKKLERNIPDCDEDVLLQALKTVLARDKKTTIFHGTLKTTSKPDVFKIVPENSLVGTTKEQLESIVLGALKEIAGMDGTLPNATTKAVALKLELKSQQSLVYHLQRTKISMRDIKMKFLEWQSQERTRHTAKSRSSSAGEHGIDPIADKLKGKEPSLPGKGFIDKEASIKKINELLWYWNYMSFALSHKRKSMERAEEKTGRVKRSIKVLANQIERRIDSFRGILSDGSIAKLKRAAELLRGGNEPAANMILTALMDEAQGLKNQVLDERLKLEIDQSRVFYSGGYWRVREQRYVSSGKWGTSVLSYKYQRYNTLWEAFRAMDHQVDTELAERTWLFECVCLIDKITSGLEANKERIDEEIDRMLEKLKRIRVDDKRLARIILESAKEMLETDRTSKGISILALAHDSFIRRIEDIDRIIDKLGEGKLKVLRSEADNKNRYLYTRAREILGRLSKLEYGFAKDKIGYEVLGDEGAKYMREPNLAIFFDPMIKIYGRLKKHSLRRQDIESAARFFELFKKAISLSMFTDAFMQDYRETYVKGVCAEGEQAPTQLEAFEATFEIYRESEEAIAEDTRFYKRAFYMAAFVPAKIGKKGERRDNPEFLRYSNTIITTLAEMVRIKEQGLRLLLHEGIGVLPEGPIQPGLFNGIQEKIDAAA